MCIKGVLHYCVQYTAYSTVLYTTSSMIKKIMTGGLGGGIPGPPLGYAHDYRYLNLAATNARPKKDKSETSQPYNEATTQCC